MTMGTILKRYRLILCCALLFMSGAGSASAQHYIGVMGGWGGGSARFKPAKETGYEWGLYSGGLSYKFYSDTKYVGAIEIDLMFTQKGFNYDLAFESDESYHRRINAIELPLIWQPHFYLFQRHARFFINLGIQVSYNLSSTYSRVSKTTGILESGKYAMQLNRDNRFGYGLCGGAGLAFLFGQQAAPFDSGQVPYFVAQGLGIPAISNIISLKAETDSLVAVSQKSDHILTYRISSPAVCLIGNCKRTYLRVPTLREKLAVSKKEALCHTFSVEEQPSYQPEHLVRNMSERSPVLYHNLEPQEAADQILNILKEEVSR